MARPEDQAEDQTEAEPADAGQPQSEQPEPEWKRRKRLAEVFGDVLPETTSDERGDEDSGTSEDWLKSQVPPHHG